MRLLAVTRCGRRSPAGAVACGYLLLHAAAEGVHAPRGRECGKERGGGDGQTVAMG